MNATWTDYNPKTPIHVRIYTENTPRTDVETFGRGSDLIEAGKIREEALSKALNDTGRDGRKRWVVVEMVLNEAYVFPERAESNG